MRKSVTAGTSSKLSSLLRLPTQFLPGSIYDHANKMREIDPLLPALFPSSIRLLEDVSKVPKNTAASKSMMKRESFITLLKDQGTPNLENLGNIHTLVQDISEKVLNR